MGFNNTTIRICSNPVCEKQGIFECVGCFHGIYCSKECQMDHWNNGHKQACESFDPRPIQSCSNPVCNKCACSTLVVSLKKCSECFHVRYCSKKCQRYHWKNGHKQACETLAFRIDNGNTANTKSLLKYYHKNCTNDVVCMAYELVSDDRARTSYIMVDISKKMFLVGKKITSAEKWYLCLGPQIIDLMKSATSCMRAIVFIEYSPNKKYLHMHAFLVKEKGRIILQSCMNIITV